MPLPSPSPLSTLSFLPLSCHFCFLFPTPPRKVTTLSLKSLSPLHILIPFHQLLLYIYTRSVAFLNSLRVPCSGSHSGGGLFTDRQFSCSPSISSVCSVCTVVWFSTLCFYFYCVVVVVFLVGGLVSASAPSRGLRKMTLHPTSSVACCATCVYSA